MRARRIRSVAIVDPVGDSGIGGYTHELAEGLVDAGVRVDLYTRRRPFALWLPRRYRLFPVLARPIEARAAEVAEIERTVVGPQWRDPSRPALPAWWNEASEEARDELLADEMAGRLAGGGYDAVWTQWPRALGSPADLRGRLRERGVPLIHTVHNVLPHERGPGDHEVHGAAYEASDALVVHSAQAARALAAEFPGAAPRVVESRHGTYTVYFRDPSLRGPARARLGLGDGPCVLFFGGVRPYKNVDALLAAMADPRCRGWTLVVAGWEWGFHDMVPGDPLGRTRRAVQRLGLEARVRLLPGTTDLEPATELFEACDAVALPYAASSGSGVLCMGMTFGRQVIATPVGGMAEYLDAYPRSTLLAGAEAADIADGLVRAAGALRERPQPCAAPPELGWGAIARRLVPALETMLGAALLVT
ncbi:MAG: glycosyl transferase group 1 [Gemmatimonadetes bacterium]|nr:glycosyl transferase group 1 [Gemmatimonadota bacterium]